MNVLLRDVAWHQAMGKLVGALDRPTFWTLLVRTLGQYVNIDNWVALMFGEGPPVVFAESPAQDGGPDLLFQDYVRGLYLLDPFYLAGLELTAPALLTLPDVAPDRFEQTEYCRRYFHLNVVTDEMQYSLPLDGCRVLALSIGGSRAFTPEQRALLGVIQPWVFALMRQRLHWEREALAPPVLTPELTPKRHTLLEAMALRTGITLTPREFEVARLALSGSSNKEIARKLAISAETVKVHRKHVYAKLGIKSQSELFILFLQAQGSDVGDATASPDLLHC